MTIPPTHFSPLAQGISAVSPRPLSNEMAQAPVATAPATPSSPPDNGGLRDVFERAVDAQKRALNRADADLGAAGSLAQAASAGARQGLAAAVFGGASLLGAAGTWLGARIGAHLGDAAKGAEMGAAIGAITGSVVGGLTLGPIGAIAGVVSGMARFQVSGTARPAPTTVTGLDLNRYQGTWYEVARYDNAFEKPGEAARAQYTVQPDGRVRVENTAYDPVTGEYRNVVGSASVGKEGDTSKLRVSFVPGVGKYGVGAADYWVVDLQPDYQYAVVGDPARRAMWVLSRTPQLDDATLEGIKERAAAQGFDPARLIETPPFPQS